MAISFPDQLEIPSLLVHLTEWALKRVKSEEGTETLHCAGKRHDGEQGTAVGGAEGHLLKSDTSSSLSPSGLCGLPSGGALCTGHNPPGTEGHPQHLQAFQASSGCKRSLGQSAALYVNRPLLD